MKPISVAVLSLGAMFLIFLVAPSVALRAQESTYTVHPATQDPAVKVTLDDLKRWEDELSNWGRWGPNDQRGTLNLVTPEKTREATRLVRDAVSVSLQHFPDFDGEAGIDEDRHTESRHWMTSVDPVTGEVRGALDAVRFGLHDGMVSHMDALCHYGGAAESPSTRPGDGSKLITYNGYSQNLRQEGCDDLAVDKMGPGYLTRGILVDLPLLKGVEWLKSSTPVFVSDLEEWEEFAGVKVGPGDALLVRTGRWAMRDALGPWAYNEGAAGLHASVLPWLHERGVTLLASDAVNDVQPAGVEGIRRPVHQVTQVIMGLPLVDNAYLEDVAREAQKRQRWEFMLTWQVMSISGGTASPFNALATF